MITFDAEGFRVFSTEGSDRNIYVDPASGSDTFDGLSEITPKASLDGEAGGLSLWRSGTGDHLWLRRGSATSIELSLTSSGRSADEPLVFGAYGSLSDPLPILETANTGEDHSVLRCWGDAQHVWFQSVHFRWGGAVGGSSWYGIDFLGTTAKVSFEDCDVEGFYSNRIQSNGPGKHEVGFYRCRLHRMWATGATHSQGMYAQFAIFTVRECYLGSNGWDGTNTASAFVTAHNLYMQEEVEFTVERNISVSPANFGMTSNSGPGTFDNNLIVDAPGGIICRSCNVTVTNNVIIGSRATANGNQAIGIVCNSQNGDANTQGDPASTVTGDLLVENNLLLHALDTSPDFAAIYVLHNDPEQAVNHPIRDNVVFNRRGPGLQVRVLNGAAETDLMQNVEGNRIYEDNATGLIVDWGAAARDPARVTFQGNAYWAQKAASGWFVVNGSTIAGTAAWSTFAGEAATTYDQATLLASFPDSSVTLDSYAGILGIADQAELVGAIAANRRANWNTALMAEPINDYLRAGFGMALTSGGTPNVPPIAEAGPAIVLTDTGRTNSVLVHLDATGSSDPDGTLAADAATWRVAATIVSTLMEDDVAFSCGTRSVTLTIRDDGGAESFDATPVIITPASPANPRFIAGVDALRLITDAYTGLTTFEFEWGLGEGDYTLGTAMIQAGPPDLLIENLDMAGLGATEIHWRARVWSPGLPSAWTADQVAVPLPIPDPPPGGGGGGGGGGTGSTIMGVITPTDLRQTSTTPLLLDATLEPISENRHTLRNSRSDVLLVVQTNGVPTTVNIAVQAAERPGTPEWPPMVLNDQVVVLGEDETRIFPPMPRAYNDELGDLEILFPEGVEGVRVGAIQLPR